MSFLSDDQIRAHLKRYGVRPTSKRGQSFLKNHRIASDIVQAAEITSDDSILEVGGGLGVLTKLLVQDAEHVYVVELDSGLAQALRDMFVGRDNISIIEGDALRVPLPDVSKIVSNLPYSISSEVTFRLLHEIRFEQAILMYQKEFAERLYAIPGSSAYSRLSVNIGYQAEVEHLMDVPAENFYPRPAVDSIVVKLKPATKEPRAKSEEVFFWMINGIYSYPNKYLRKALRIWFRNMNVEKNLVEIVLDSCKGEVRGDMRLRTISIENLVHLADSLFLLIEKNELPDPRGKKK